MVKTTAKPRVLVGPLVEATGEQVLLLEPMLDDRVRLTLEVAVVVDLALMVMDTADWAEVV
nr:hypothetical protein [Exiguobacterium sp. AT1b]